MVGIDLEPELENTLIIVDNENGGKSPRPTFSRDHNWPLEGSGIRRGVQLAGD